MSGPKAIQAFRSSPKTAVRLNPDPGNRRSSTMPFQQQITSSNSLQSRGLVRTTTTGQRRRRLRRPISSMSQKGQDVRGLALKGVVSGRFFRSVPKVHQRPQSVGTCFSSDLTRRDGASTCLRKRLQDDRHAPFNPARLAGCPLCLPLQ